MASLHPNVPADTLEQQLARTRRQPGDVFGQGGWRQTHGWDAPPPTPSSTWLVLLPFIVLLVVGLVLTVGLLVIASWS